MNVPKEIYENGLGEYVDEDLTEDEEKIAEVKIISGTLNELEKMFNCKIEIIGMVSREKTFGPKSHPSKLFNSTKMVKREIKKQAFYLGCEGIYDFNLKKRTTPVPDPKGHNTKFVQDIMAEGMAARKTDVPLNDSKH